MAVDIRRTTVLCMPRQQWPDRESSPERTKIWFEPKPKNTVQKVPVIYYLSRNGQLEHPHFMEVPLISSPKGLYLQDVMNRLNFLRGQDMAKLYSWSSKRSYRNGFVWQDLSKNEFIYPCHGHEYILKGSQLLETSLSFRSYERASSSSSMSNISTETKSSSVDSNVPAILRKKNQSWSSFEDLREYQVYKAKTAAEFAEKAANAATQTEDHKGRPRGKDIEEMEGSGETKPSAEEVSKSLSKSSLEKCSKIDNGSADSGIPTVEHDRLPSGRMKASTVLMQLIGCGSRRIKDL
ncbi:protein SOSEKI 2-like [Juglans microcarpa x Juglans regia]|uniref:protein SOSEKI 2-like n=1 Tax=Juglans microcarpa x Juglans regia TaxID=2249226 RepID=UPI001B7F6332|nr:protein SOSEKI 2-like [Juglans microcarpa x Juglans regia]